jgi:2-methylcitrate dehydratase
MNYCFASSAGADLKHEAQTPAREAIAMTCAERMATFVRRSGYEDLSDSAREQLKIRILYSLGRALSALEGEPVQILRRTIGGFAPQGKCTTIGGGTTVPDSAAFYNGAIIRYLDFNDAYVAKGETCDPSGNLVAILAGAVYADASGRELMTALAIAHPMQCRLCDVAPVRDKGLDHSTQGSYSVTAGVAKSWVEMRTANAIAICGTAFNALWVTRTGQLSHGKGLALPNTAVARTHRHRGSTRGKHQQMEQLSVRWEHSRVKERTQ